MHLQQDNTATLALVVVLLLLVLCLSGKGFTAGIWPHAW